MCGRFTLTVDPNELREILRVFSVQVPQQSFDNLKPRYNIAPTQPVAVVTNDSPRKLDFHRWGLIPSWAKDDAVGAQMINARAETLAERPAFRTSLKRRRCMILADGFYEWYTPTEHDKSANPFLLDLPAKVPLYFRVNDPMGDAGPRVFAFAGLWDERVKDGEALRTCTIITTEAQGKVQRFHHRMPVILQPNPRVIDEWLQPTERKVTDINQFLYPYWDNAEIYAVNPIVNRPGNNLPLCIQPLNDIRF
jgi:putative SOS response-associated peptidase YedK